MPVAPAQPGQNPSQVLLEYYRRLLAELGPQGWWPARTRMEVILGAILVQNTAWENARKALARLRNASLLSLPRLRQVSRAELEGHIRPAGFYRQKARTIRNFLDWLGQTHAWSLDRLLQRSAGDVRRELLSLKGLGPETVDAILLYAGHQPWFVADAYTRRILARHELVRTTDSYADVQGFLHQHLPADQALYNEYHALFVEVGKRYCRNPAPRCDDCPLRDFLPRESSEVTARIGAAPVIPPVTLTLSAS
jgi:endonuclease III related protein